MRYRRVVSKTLRLLALLAAGLGLGCGGAQIQSAPSTTGTYHGPNELDFLITAPVRRQMPPERHNGAAEVVEDDGERVTLELRMLEGGDVCRIEATRAEPTASTLSVAPGQECRSRFAHEGLRPRRRRPARDGAAHRGVVVGGHGGGARRRPER